MTNQIRAKEHLDWATHLLACRDKWFESRQLRFTFLVSQRTLAKVDFLQSWQNTQYRHYLLVSDGECENRNGRRYESSLTSITLGMEVASCG